MIFKNFRLHIILRVALICLLFTIVYFSLSAGYIIVPLFASLFLLVTIGMLIHYVERTNRTVTGFFESIRYADFNQHFKIEGENRAFDAMRKSFNDVVTDFQKIRAEKEAHYFYLRSIIHHIEIGILAFTSDGTVEVINNAAKRLFGVVSLKNIKGLQNWNAEFYLALQEIKTGESKLVKVLDDNTEMQLSLFATEFLVHDKSVHLVSFKNIHLELEQQELEAWQKLIQVLTHEIMNSVAPISSLSGTVHELLKSYMEQIKTELPEDFDTETIEDVSMAIETIHKRSSGLIHFVQTYRNLARIPKPNLRILGLNSFFTHIKTLMHEELENRNIRCSISIDPISLDVMADEQLLEQVLINLLKNSMQALTQTSDPYIEIQAYIDVRGRKTIVIKDNGQGIIPEVGDKVFIPFFTTKPNGSGIGLSLAKQIMRLHGGNISVSSEPDVETCFTITF